MNKFSFWFLSPKNTSFTDCSLYDNTFLILKSAKLSNQLCCKFEELICISRRKCDFLGNSKKISSNHSSESNSFTSHTIRFVNKPPFRPARLQKTKSESVPEFYRWPNRLFCHPKKNLNFKIPFSCINIKGNQVLVKSDDINVSKSSQTCQLNSVPQWMNK